MVNELKVAAFRLIDVTPVPFVAGAAISRPMLESERAAGAVTKRWTTNLLAATNAGGGSQRINRQATPAGVIIVHTEESSESARTGPG